MRNTGSQIKIGWLVACAVVLLWWTGAYGLNDEVSPALKSEAMIYVIVAMVALSFPIGLVWTVVLAIGARALHGAGIELETSLWIGVILYWLSSLGMGYLQWFVIVPRWRARKHATAE